MGYFAGEAIKKYDIAEQYYNQALKLKKSIGHLIGICRVYSNLCIVLLHAEKKHAFNYRYRKATALIRKYELFRIEFELYGKIGEFYLEKGKNNTGKRWIKKAIKVMEKNFTTMPSEYEKYSRSLHKLSPT